MTTKSQLEDMFSSGVFSTVQKLFMVLFYWTLGRLTNDEAKELFTGLGYTFTVPSTTGIIILTDGNTSNYTIYDLVKSWHDNYYSVSKWGITETYTLINKLQSYGFITTTEQNNLKGLGW